MKKDDQIILGDMPVPLPEQPANLPALVCPVQVPARIADLAQIENLAEVFGSPKSVFVEQIIDGIAAKAAKEAEGVDVSKAGHREKLKSIAAQVASAKEAIDRAGKGLNEEKRAEIDAVDAERRLFRGRLETLRDEIKAPALKWEADEAARRKKLYERLDAMKVDMGVYNGLIDLRARREWIAAIVIDESWQEVQDEAREQYRRSLDWLDERIQEAEAREAQEAELVRLKAELARREQEEAERKAEEARVAAEKAAAERKEREAKEREAEIARAKEAAAEAERQAAAARIEAAERAKKEAEERAAHAAEVAAAAERNRIAEEQRLEKEAAEKRAADKAHREQARSDFIEAMLKAMDFAKEHKMGRAEFASLVFDEALAGRIPRVTVQL